MKGNQPLSIPTPTSRFSPVLGKSFKKTAIHKKNYLNFLRLEARKGGNTKLAIQKVKEWTGAERQCDVYDITKECLWMLKEISGRFQLDFERNMMLPTLIYLERYVQKNGLIRVSSLCKYFLISMLVVCKAWEKNGITNASICEEFDLPSSSKKNFAKAEKKFVQSINHDLHLTKKDLEDMEDYEFCWENPVYGQQDYNWPEMMDLGGWEVINFPMPDLEFPMLEEDPFNFPMY